MNASTLGAFVTTRPSAASGGSATSSTSPFDASHATASASTRAGSSAIAGNTRSSNRERTLYLARAGIVAAAYAAATLLCLLVLQGLAWGPVQFRISEAVCVVAVLLAPAVPGLTVGCVIANLINTALAGAGALGLLDVVFGSLATLLGALWCRRFSDRPKLALAGFVIFNALIVPAYLPIMLQGLGFYTIPFTDISLDGTYIYMYLFGVLAIGIGEAVVVYLLGLPLLAALKSAGVGQERASKGRSA